MMTRAERRRIERIRHRTMSARKHMPRLKRSDRRAYVREMGLQKVEPPNE